MKKLKHNLVITVPESARKEIESRGLAYIDQLVIKFYYKYDDHEDGINGEVVGDMNEWLLDNNISAPYSEEDVMAIKLRWT